jgi:hypothetical protein
MISRVDRVSRAGRVSRVGRVNRAGRAAGVVRLPHDAARLVADVLEVHSVKRALR